MWVVGGCRGGCQSRGRRLEAGRVDVVKVASGMLGQRRRVLARVVWLDRGGGTLGAVGSIGRLRGLLRLQITGCATAHHGRLVPLGGGRPGEQRWYCRWIGGEGDEGGGCETLCQRRVVLPRACTRARRAARSPSYRGRPGGGEVGGSAGWKDGGMCRGGRRHTQQAAGVSSGRGGAVLRQRAEERLDEGKATGARILSWRAAFRGAGKVEWQGEADFVRLGRLARLVMLAHRNTYTRLTHRRGQ